MIKIVSIFVLIFALGCENDRDYFTLCELIYTSSDGQIIKETIELPKTIQVYTNCYGIMSPIDKGAWLDHNRIYHSLTAPTGWHLKINKLRDQK